MTKAGFTLLLAGLVSCLAVGAYLGAPRPADLGGEELACADWFDAPRPGAFTLRGCVVDARYAVAREHAGSVEVVALVSVFPPGWEASTGDPEPAALVMLSEEPLHRAVVSRRLPFLGQPFVERRFAERHRAELVYTADVTGEIELQVPDTINWQDELQPLGEFMLLDATAHAPLGRASGIVLFLFGLFGLLILVPFQRRWIRRRDRLTGKGRPLAF